MFSDPTRTDASFDTPASPVTPPAHDALHTATGTPQKKENPWFEIFKVVVIAALIVAPIRLYIAQPFVVSGASMDRTFATGEYLIIDQLSYHFEAPKRGDVIVFRFPLEPSKFFIKRVIGLPTETVILQGKATFIVNKEHPEGFSIDEPYVAPEKLKDNSLSTTLASGEYFVMGDNRAESSDSRSWGPVDKEYIVGRALLRLFPITHLGLFPGSAKYSQTGQGLGDEVK